ncbi:MAG: hypothetical protein AB7W37_18195 [Syntrophobacteraceae bacterium]
MSPTVMPEGEGLRKAVKWLSAELQENPDQSVQVLVEKAVFTFDLSPKDSDFLIRFIRESREKGEVK